MAGVTSDSAWDSTSAAALMIRQVEALDAWNVAREQRERMLLAPGGSREMRLTAARRLEVLQRAHQAVLDRTARFLSREPSPLPERAALTAVIAHRQEWFAQKLTEALEERGVDVISVVENGADAVGTVVAEQPTILLVEERLAMLTGEEVISEVRLFAPHTIVGAQVTSGEQVGAMCDAGARTAFTRQIPPVDVADGLVALLQVDAA